MIKKQKEENISDLFSYKLHALNVKNNHEPDPM